MIFLLALFIQSAFAYVPSVGPQPMSQSQAVTIATDQTPIPISGNFTATVDTTGLATSAGQTTGNNSLASILASVLTDAQLRASPVPVSATIDTTGLATDTGQATGNASLAAIKLDVDKIPSSPAAEHTTAVSPNSCRLSDGAAFISTLPVSLAALPALSAGSAVIGHVIVDTAPTTAVTIGSLPALSAGSAVIGHVIVDTAPSTAVTGPLTDAQLRASAVPVSVVSPLPVTVVSPLPVVVASPLPVVMGALPAGSAVIGHVIVDTAPTTAVTIAALPALAAGSAVIGHVIVDTAPTTAITAAALPLPSGASTDSSVTGLEVAQGSTTSGQNGAVVQGAVTTGAPTYTTAKTNPLSLTTAGALRVDGSAVTQPASLASLPALSAGSAVIGHVIVDTAPTTAVTIATLPALTAGSAVVGHVIADASSAVIGHVIADSGSTTAVTGTVTANATLSAETTKVIGTVNVASGQTVGLAAGSAVIGHVIADSGSTTAVTGTVTVSEATTGGNPCMNPASTLVSITGATSTNNATQIIALSGSTKIYICSMTIIGVSGTSPTFSLVQGTGSNCVTNQATVVQAWATTAGTLYAFANPVAVGVAGGELCYKDGGTSPVQNYQINYVQQ